MGAVVLSGCENSRSILHPAGEDADQIANLFWVMAIGGSIVWLIVIGLAIYAAYVRPETTHARGKTTWLVIGGGVALPTVVLAALLIYGLGLMPRLLAFGDGPRITVSGERWWWRVTYHTSEGAVVTANALRLPVGERSEIALLSPDVIHAFWIPALGGKVDMIPGRENRLALTPTRTGTFEGACAEYCGGAHAQMAFEVEVVEAEAFAAWLRSEAAPAAKPQSASARKGADDFLQQGCGACHAIRGTAAQGLLGPDLTHLASRRMLAAGTVANTRDNLRRWIEDPQAIKPTVAMPGYAMLPAAELDAIADYLAGLQ